VNEVAMQYVIEAAHHPKGHPIGDCERNHANNRYFKHLWRMPESANDSMPSKSGQALRGRCQGQRITGINQTKPAGDQLAPCNRHDVLQVTAFPFPQILHTSTHWLILCQS